MSPERTHDSQSVTERRARTPLITGPPSGTYPAAGDRVDHGQSQQLVELRGETLLLLTEYIPFGATNLAALEDRLETTESLREIHLTDETDHDPERGVLTIEEPEAKVAVIWNVRPMPSRHTWRGRRPESSRPRKRIEPRSGGSALAMAIG